MIKIKDVGNGYRVRISCDENGNELSRTASFNKKCPLWTESEECLKDNAILPQFTAEELAVKDQKEKQSAFDSMISERNARVVEADKWELLSIQKRFDITQDQVEEYKQILCDMPVTLTINSTLEELKNPNFPDRIIEGLL